MNMSVSIIKPKWNADVEAYIATINGKKYIVDLDFSPSGYKKKNSSKSKGKTRIRSNNTGAIKTFITSGASFNDVVANFPQVSKASYYQYRNRLGLTKAQKGKN
ncbi:MAG: hypothetical protein WCX75_04820 [Fibrobacteraceae bacterium]